MAKKMLAPVHPGEVLLEEFLKPMNLSRCVLPNPCVWQTMRRASGHLGWQRRAAALCS